MKIRQKINGIIGQVYSDKYSKCKNKKIIFFQKKYKNKKEEKLKKYYKRTKTRTKWL
jgi:hypothetical protein